MAELSQKEKETVIVDLIAEEINPQVAMHGGIIFFKGLEGNKVKLQLGGGCQGCGMAALTLREGIEKRMKEIAPWVEGIIDVTDHEAGMNPYMSPCKK